jgi:pimeloyl-ACP methyl ester carboxylesterase
MPGIPLLHFLHLKDGKIENDSIISFWVETDYGGNKLRADYKGDLEDEEIRFKFTTTLTGPQADSGGVSILSPLVVHRIGTGNETHDEIEKILHKKIEGGEIAGPVPSPDWKDPSPHSVQFITVDKNVQLEVLDWGGSGRPIVLLAGLDATAHIYDDFAPKLTKDYHVFGITRRGFGASSKPDSGYEADKLGDDVIAVLDSLKLKKSVLVGHSRAGQELSSVASRFPDRISGLIYLDAAYQYAFDSDSSIDKVTEDLKLEEESPTSEETPASSSGEKPVQQITSMPSPPPPGAADLASISTALSWMKRTLGFVYPEAEMRQHLIISPDGRIIGNRIPAEETLRANQAISQGTQSYKNIPVRCLAIYADYSFKEPWTKDAEPEVKELNVIIKSAISDFSLNSMTAFEKGVPSARVVRLSESDHCVFLTNEEEVLREMHDFLESLP